MQAVTIYYTTRFCPYCIGAKALLAHTHVGDCDELFMLARDAKLNASLKPNGENDE